MLWAHEIFLRLKSNHGFDQVLAAQATKKGSPFTLTRRLMPSSIDSETLVNTEKGFLRLQ